jgi:hypothetical protein
MKIRYVPGETVQEASEIDTVEEFITITKALHFFADRTLRARGEVFALPSDEQRKTLDDAARKRAELEIEERLSIEVTFDNLALYMQAGIVRLADGYGASHFNQRHTNFILDSLDALSSETAETLGPDEAGFLSYVPAAHYMLDHLEEGTYFNQTVVASTHVN